ncbi:MAG: nitric oxide reductase activation protein NorD [Gallionella sp.]
MKHIFDLLARELQSYLGRADMKSPVDSQRLPGKTRLSDVQRRIRIYLHALWGCDFVIKSIGNDPETRESRQPFITRSFIHLPGHYHDFMQDGVMLYTGMETYRAAATHAAAHIMYSTQHFSDNLVNRWQRAVIATIEDARVESLAIREFPGLKRLWIKQHIADPSQNQTADDHLNRLARALLDETYRDDDPWISRGRSVFMAARDLDAYNFSWDIGLELERAFPNRKIKFDGLRKSGAAYRDDNRHLWASEDSDSIEPIDIPWLRLLSTNKTVSGSEQDKERQSTMQMRIESAAAEDTYLYPEWDYRTEINTPSWVTLRERSSAAGDLNIIEDIVAQNRHLITRMKNLLLAIQYKGVRRIRKQQEGDEIDINAAIRAMTDFRMGILPDDRIMMSSLRKTRDISVLVLLDLSGSANQKILGQDYTVLQLTRKVCVLFAEAIEAVGDPLAIHGFHSRGRHDVDYFRLKDFDQPYDDVPKARIAGMAGDRSTRLGAAVRHATHHLNEHKSGKKLLMTITDGAPADIDTPDRHYLRHDLKHAVIEAQQNGIHTYCFGLDPKADEYISRIFGARNYMVVDHVKSLPEKMLHIYAGLTL